MKVVRDAETGVSSVENQEFNVMNPPLRIAEEIFKSANAQTYEDYVLTVFNLEEVDGCYHNPGREYVLDFRRWRQEWHEKGYLICWGLKHI